MSDDVQPGPAHVEVSIPGPPIKITALVANGRGPLPVTAAFHTAGGPILISASGSGKRRSDKPASIIGMEVRLDDDVKGVCKVAADSSVERQTFIPVWIPVAGLDAGRHVLLLRPFTMTVTDEDDCFNVTITEYQKSQEGSP
jgi:hypothetical protein